MRAFEIGVALNTWRSSTDPTTVGWAELRDLAVRAEALGFDTVWFPDSFVGRLVAGGPIFGFWDAGAVLAGFAAVTSRIKVGSWVFPSLFRDPALVAKQAATIDEISSGRFILGYGAGDVATASRAFGLPDDHVYERFEEALEIIVPLLRAGHATFEGSYRRVRDLPQLPPGPRPGSIPLLLAAHGPRGYRHAARHADIWSCYAVGSGDAEEFRPRVTAFEAACAEVGRDPATVGRSAGIVVAPLARKSDDVRVLYGTATTGPAVRIGEALRSLRDAGLTQVEMMLEPMTMEALEALAEALPLLDAG